IVAHSMGALVTRYYLRYGSEDVLDAGTFHPNHVGAAKTRKVILLGAPNMGSISGLQTFMKGEKFGLARLYPEIVATMPGAYQLLPHPDRDWMITLDGKKWDRDLYSIQTWRDLQWSIFDSKARERIRKRFSSPAEAERYLEVLERFFEKNLVRGKRFHRALSIPLKQTPVRYIIFGGDCVLTPARCALERVKGHPRIRFHPSEIINRVSGVDYDKLMLEPGDGRVTKPSLLARNSLDPSAPTNNNGAFPIAYAVFLCESHSRLAGNITFQDNLLNILLSQETTEDRMNRGEDPLLKRPRVRSAIPDS
ncbi:MAG: esterase/lipase family protein, partial [Acidiferrobacterales bacterium]